MENCNFNSIETSRRVLSIQSHVVYGYVGNKSASFPLQLLGFDVDSINSVQLSNHTGYKHVTGQVLTSEELQQLFDGLKANELLTCTHLLTGYVGNVTFLTKLVNLIKDLKETNPDLYYVCDPVMGDNGKMYVPAEVLPVYRDQVIPLADLITPNQFETELLTGIHIESKENIFEAMEVFHQKGVKTVVLSSVQLANSEDLELYGSSTLNDKRTVVSMKIPKLLGSFTGTGDLFSALLLAWMAKTDGDLKVSCEKVINTIQCVLKRTLSHASGKDITLKSTVELRLIQSKRDIENPPDDLKCEIL